MVALIALISSAVLVSDVGAKVVAACESAICRVAGADCPALRAGDSGRVELPGAAAIPDRSPSRPPIPKPVCTPDPGGAWVERLHAHNDYENANPLEDALGNGATSVEPDVWLDENGRLQLKHDETDRSRGTLRDVYVDPLIARAAKNGGQIYQGRDQPFELILEVKHGDDSVYQKILDETRGLPPGVHVIIPDGTPGASMGKQPPGVFFYGTLGKDCSLPLELDPANPRYDRERAKHYTMLNGAWADCADRDKNGKISESEQEAFNEVVRRAHDAGLKVRIWGGPDGTKRLGSNKSPGEFASCPRRPWAQKCDRSAQRAWWRAQQDAGADYLVTNHLGQGGTFLRTCGDEK